MRPSTTRFCLLILVTLGVLGPLCARTLIAADDSAASGVPSDYSRSRAGEQREVWSIQLCWCPPGKFLMGSPRTESERRPGENQVEVTLTRGFWMSKFETTQGQWKRVMGQLPGELTTELPEGDDFPVGNVNFAETEAFCGKLTELARESGRLPRDWEFRLPTEAEWEYACRAGTTTATAFGDKLSSKQANFKGKPYNGAEPGPSLNRAAKVGSYPANAWSLHDMHGNIFEWCRDWYHAKLPGGVDPDLYPAKDSATRSEHGGVSRVRRGGCWADDGWACRSAFRLRFEPERRYDHIGFRMVLAYRH
jgi:formylglycine-generating enzyme